MRVSSGPFDLVYHVEAGHLYLHDQDDSRILLAKCYSGAPGYINNPAHETKVAKGPIPRGLWKLGVAIDHPTLGPIAFRLTPVEVPSLRASGRSGFLIHGDNSRSNGTASRGCIIAPRPAREAIRALGVKVLNCV